MNIVFIIAAFTIIFSFPVFGNENELNIEPYNEVIEEFVENTENIDNLDSIHMDEIIEETESKKENEWNLTYLGTFRITHYCPCEKCNGKWAKVNKTYSGTDLCPGRTIAVSKSQIPLGTEVVINDHIYIAEDTGSGIKDNCIDILVSSHQEAMNNGVYYTDVYVKEK